MKFSVIFYLITLILLIVVVLLIWSLVRVKKKVKLKEAELQKHRLEFSEIIDKDKEIIKRENEVNELELRLNALKEKYLIASNTYKNLNEEIQTFKESLDMIDNGVYEPHYDFDTSEDFKNALTKNKEKQKKLIKFDQAVKCFTNWSVGNSQKKGEVMIKRAIKLTIRAFNGECDSLISKVRWNNIELYEKRIRKSYDAINKMNKSNDVHIQPEFLILKLDELRLTHEYELKKYEEKEEQRRIREQIREEEKAKRDYEKAIKEAEKEEKLLQNAMEKVRLELQKSSEEERAKYESQLKELKQKLEFAESKNQRALSMAQQTKSGHVYVISNIGSFGENIYKIGMTRRLNPMDRVLELGDASVPFRFDVHAMIYSENAPELENKLHKAFHPKRLNHVNLRREYFDISLDEIAKVVHENHGRIEFTKIAEAREYRESIAIRMKLNSNSSIEKEIAIKFPSTEELFN